MDTKTKTITIIIVAALFVAGAAALLVRDSDGNDPDNEGLYRLNPTISNVNMGQCSATPGMIVTIEQMYKDYYGEIVDDKLTIDDAKKDEEFWNKYCVWDSMATLNEDGTFDVKISTAAKGDDIVKIPVCDTVVSMGTMYTETLYFIACAENDATPYSPESMKNAGVCDYLSKTIKGGMLYSYYSSDEAPFMLNCVPESGYFDLGVNSVQKVEKEKLTSGLQDAKSKGDNVVYFASGTRMSTTEFYDNNVGPCIETKANYAFFAPSSVNEVFASIECIGQIMGFENSVIEKVIQDIQLRLYKVYYSVESKTTDTKPVVFWEAGSGKAVKSAMAKIIVEFLGFDSKLLDGAEHDLENLLMEKPDYIVFYTNDTRTDDAKMRVNL